METQRPEPLVARALWPRCTFQNFAWGNPPTPAFWVECHPEVVAGKVLPLMDPRWLVWYELELARYERDRRARTGRRSRLGFLVSRDLRSIMPLPIHYPYGNLWNAYNPFRAIRETTIDDLHELVQIPIDALVREAEAEAMDR